MRDHHRRVFELRLEVHQLEQAVQPVVGWLRPERAAALAREEQVRWQQETGRCHLCMGPCDDHPFIEPWPWRDEEEPR